MLGWARLALIGTPRTLKDTPIALAYAPVAFLGTRAVLDWARLALIGTPKTLKDTPIALAYAPIAFLGTRAPLPKRGELHFWRGACAFNRLLRRMR